MTSSYLGRHVLITGGAGALGTAVVAALSAAGAICHTPTVEEIDLRDEQAVVALYAGLPSLWASIHLAGGFAMTPVVDTSLANLRTQMDLNLTTSFLCCREAVRAIRKTGAGGRIVNVAARPALVPAAGMLAYATAKAAVAGLTRCLAEEVIADKILVNAVVPSIMDTPSNRRNMPDADFSRWPRTEEVAATISFLASFENALTSGTLVPVYGRA